MENTQTVNIGKPFEQLEHSNAGFDRPCDRGENGYYGKLSEKHSLYFPAPEDFVHVNDLNYNFKIIDEKLGSGGDSLWRETLQIGEWSATKTYRTPGTIVKYQNELYALRDFNQWSYIPSWRIQDGTLSDTPGICVHRTDWALLETPHIPNETWADYESLFNQVQIYNENEEFDTYLTEFLPDSNEDYIQYFHPFYGIGQAEARIGYRLSFNALPENYHDVRQTYQTNFVAWMQQNLRFMRKSNNQIRVLCPPAVGNRAGFPRVPSQFWQNIQYNSKIEVNDWEPIKRNISVYPIRRNVVLTYRPETFVSSEYTKHYFPHSDEPVAALTIENASTTACAIRLFDTGTEGTGSTPGNYVSEITHNTGDINTRGLSLTYLDRTQYKGEDKLYSRICLKEDCITFNLNNTTEPPLEVIQSGQCNMIKLHKHNFDSAPGDNVEQGCIYVWNCGAAIYAGQKWHRFMFQTDNAVSYAFK